MEMNIQSSVSSIHLDLQRVFKGASGVGSRYTGGRAAMQRTADPWTRVQIPARAPFSHSVRSLTSATHVPSI